MQPSMIIRDEAQVDELLNERWVTLVRDDTQERGQPKMDGYRIRTHTADIPAMEAAAANSGRKVRFEVDDQVGRDDPGLKAVKQTAARLTQ